MLDIDRQEIFDTVVNHLMTMPRQSAIDGGCLYRGPDELSCAVGCLITDEEYVDAMDDMDQGSSVKSLFERNLLPHRFIPHLQLLGDLQRIHDNINNWGTLDRAYMKQDLRSIANYYTLSTAVLDEIENQSAWYAAVESGEVTF